MEMGIRKEEIFPRQLVLLIIDHKKTWIQEKEKKRKK